MRYLSVFLSIAFLFIYFFSFGNVIIKSKSDLTLKSEGGLKLVNLYAEIH